MDLWDDPNLSFSKLVLCWLLEKDPRICTTEFSASLIEAVDFDGEELGYLLKGNRIIPDAYLIEKEHKTVFLFEVEDTHPIKPAKLRKLSEIWNRLDAIDWEMRVFLIDRYMHHWSVLPLPRVWHTLEFPGAYRRSPKEAEGQRSSHDWEEVYQNLKASHILGHDGWI